MIFILLSLIFFFTYQSDIIVPPKASVDIKGTTDKTSSDALHRKPLTFVLEPGSDLGSTISDNDIPFFESLENKPGVLVSFVSGLVTILLFEQLAIINISRVINKDESFGAKKSF